MQLRNLKKSILDMPRDEAIELHRRIRKDRLDFSHSKRARKVATVKQKKDSKAMQELKKDPEKIRQLLRLLGEDV